MVMEAVKLIPTLKDYIWGGRKLLDWGKTIESDVIAESWELSFHSDGYSKTDGGERLCESATRETWGKNSEKFKEFPVLVKIIDAKENLSVQVHPSDEYALKHERSYGKTEMWYVADADEGAGLYMGFKEALTKEKFSELLANGKILGALNFVKVKKGDSFFIPAGTVHAIGAGVVIIEVQQSSNLTYRVYDYGRVGKDGKTRDLHIEKAIEVADLSKYAQPTFESGEDKRILAECKYFTVSEKKNDCTLGRDDTFVSFTVADGSGTVDGKRFSRGDTYFIPCAKRAALKGEFTAIVTEVD